MQGHNAESVQSAPGTRPPFLVCLVILAAGLVGVSSLLLLSLKDLLPAGVEIPAWVVLLNPAIMTIAAAFAGWWAAHKSGLGAPVIQAMVAGRDWKRPLFSGMKPAIIVGLIGAMVLIAYGIATQEYFSAQSQSTEQPLVTRLLYGGITEEVLLRWGLLSVIASGLSKLPFSTMTSLWLANGVAALLFGLGHLPALYGMVSDPASWLVTVIIAANAGLGFLFGALFIRYGLEAAILGHALTHLFGFVAAQLM